jgi:hypothetical protein
MKGNIINILIINILYPIIAFQLWGWESGDIVMGYGLEALALLLISAFKMLLPVNWYGDLDRLITNISQTQKITSAHLGSFFYLFSIVLLYSPIILCYIAAFGFGFVWLIGNYIGICRLPFSAENVGGWRAFLAFMLFQIAPLIEIWRIYQLSKKNKVQRTDLAVVGSIGEVVLRFLFFLLWCGFIFLIFIFLDGGKSLKQYLGFYGLLLAKIIYDIWLVKFKKDSFKFR